MKVPNPQTLASRSAMARFVEEGQKSVRIEHPNVVRVLDADTAGPVCYTVMEYCPEGSLAGWLARHPADRPIPPRWAARLVAEIADGVQQAHSLGILHRDLKPGQRAAGAGGQGRSARTFPSFCPKVSDFGLAKVLDETGQTIGDATATGAALGTRGYMSPEQFRGDRPVRDALGRLQPGRDPVRAADATTALMPGSRATRRSPGGWTTRRPRRSRAIRPDVPRDLETICRTCLAKAPGDRYPTAGALAADLRRFLNGEPVEGSPWWKRARAGLRRHRVGIVVGLTALILAIGLGIIVETGQRNNAKSWLTRMGNASIDELPKPWSPSATRPTRA